MTPQTSLLTALATLLIACPEAVDKESCPRQGHALLQIGREARQHIAVHDDAGFKVLVVGAPRTGTQSMATALSRLGLRPLHTGIELSSRLPWCNYLFGNGTFEEAMSTMAGYDSAMDEPFHLIFEEVMRRFPDCKFVLPATDPDKWYASCLEFAASHQQPTHPLLGDSRCHNLHYFGCDFSVAQSPELKARCMAGYLAHVENVRNLVPAERLLVFNMSDGYRPLANFLGKPTPDEPFPYADHFKTNRSVQLLENRSVTADNSSNTVQDNSSNTVHDNTFDIVLESE